MFVHQKMIKYILGLIFLATLNANGDTVEVMEILQEDLIELPK